MPETKPQNARSSIFYITAILLLTGFFALILWVFPTPARSVTEQTPLGTPPVCPASLAFGETIQCSIDVIAEEDAYTFTAEATDRLLARVSAPTADIDPYLRIYNPSGTLVCETWSTGTLTESNTCSLFETGTYTLRIHDFGDDDTGDYFLFLQRTNAPSNATPLSFGEVISGTLDTGLTMDAYTFSANANDKVLIRMTAPSGTPDPQFRVYRPDGISACDTWSTSTLAEDNTCSLSMTGTYTLLAGDYLAQNGGSYSLWMQRTNAPSNATPLSFGEVISDNLDIGLTMDAYTFSANANDKVLIRMTAPSGTPDPQFRVYRPDGISACDTWSTSTLAEDNTCSLSMTGTYTLLAGDYLAQNGGSYSLWMQRTNAPSNATPLSFSEVISDNLDIGLTMDAYTFSANANDKVLIRMTAPSGTPDPQFRVYRPDGISACDTWSTSTLAEDNTCSLSMTGTYTLLAGDYLAQNGGSYSLWMQRTNAPNNVARFPFEETASGRIDPIPEMDIYTFSADAGDAVSIRMSAPSGAPDPHIRVYRPDGSQACENWSTGTSVEITSCSLSDTGIFTLVAGDFGGDDIGDYTLSLGCNTPPCGDGTFAPPVLNMVSPPNGSHTASPGTTVFAAYDAVMDPTTVTTSTLAVHALGTGALSGIYSLDGGTISFTPAQPFKPSELIQTTATTGTLSVSGGAPLAPTVWWFRTAALGGTGVYTSTKQTLGNADSRGIALGDLDGDGDLDAFTTNWNQPAKIWLNDGAATFTDSGQVLVNSLSTSVALGDLDSDSDLDAFITIRGGPNQVWFNQGGIQGDTKGVFADSGQSLGSNLSTDVALGDLDGDGDLDAFVSNSTQGNTIWSNNGAGVFTDTGQSLGSSQSETVSLGDLNGDGDLDALVGNQNGEPDKVWLNDGAGAFTDSGQNLGSASTVDTDLGDLDGDGDLDAFTASNATSPDFVWLNDGAGTFTDSGQLIGQTSSYEVQLGDLDGDGDLDAFLFNCQENRVWRNDGKAGFADSGQALGSACSWGGGVGDLDGDGDLDAAEANSNANGIWLNLNPSTADLSIEKTTTVTTTTAGENLTYGIAVTNLGPDVATNLRITDTLPSQAIYLSDSAGCTQNEGGLVCSVGTLPVGGTFNLLVSVQAWSLTEQLVNSVTAAADEFDPDPSNSTATHILPITIESDITINLTHNAPPTVTKNTTFTYQTEVVNLGPAGAYSVTVEHRLPPGVDFLGTTVIEPVGGDPNCAASGGVITCQLGNLGVDGHLARSHRYRFRSIVTATTDGVDPDGGESSVSSQSPDPDLSNNGDVQDRNLFLPLVRRVLIP